MATEPQSLALPRSGVSLLIEALVLSGACFVLFVHLIPAQTSDGGIGLSPAFLPKLCVVAMGLLIVADGVLRLVQRTPPPRYSEGWGPFFRLGIAACSGTFVLQFGGPVAAVAVCCIATALALGERRLLHLFLPALFCGTVFWLVFR